MRAAIDLRDVEVYGVDTHARARTVRQWLLGHRGAGSTRIPILRGVSFQARPGDRVGVVGANGSGKSSLLKVVAGNYPIHAGRREVSGTVAPLIEMGAGFDPELTGRRNIKHTYAVRGRLRDYSREIEETIIAFAELGDKIDWPLKTYSTGMAMRLAFSSAIFQSPDILILDELMAVGDAAFIAKSKKVLLDKMDRASITLLVSHNPDHVRAWCNRGVLVHDGRIVAEDDVPAIYERYEREFAGIEARA